MVRGWHQRPHWRTSKRGKRFPAGRGSAKPKFRWQRRRPKFTSSYAPAVVPAYQQRAVESGLAYGLKTLAQMSFPQAAPAVEMTYLIYTNFRFFQDVYNCVEEDRSDKLARILVEKGIRESVPKAVELAKEYAGANDKIQEYYESFKERFENAS